MELYNWQRVSIWIVAVIAFFSIFTSSFEYDLVGRITDSILGVVLVFVLLTIIFCIENWFFTKFNWEKW